MKYEIHSLGFWDHCDTPTASRTPLPPQNKQTKNHHVRFRNVNLTLALRLMGDLPHTVLSVFSNPSLGHQSWCHMPDDWLHRVEQGHAVLERPRESNVFIVKLCGCRPNAELRHRLFSSPLSVTLCILSTCSLWLPYPQVARWFNASNHK